MTEPEYVRLEVTAEDVAEAHRIAGESALARIERGEDPFAPLVGFGECGVCGAWVEGPATSLDQFDGPALVRREDGLGFGVAGWQFVRCADHQVPELCPPETIRRQQGRKINMTDQPLRVGYQVHIPGRGAEQWIIDHIDADTREAQLHNGAGETATGPLADLTPTAWEIAARQFEHPDE